MQLSDSSLLTLTDSRPPSRLLFNRLFVFALFVLILLESGCTSPALSPSPDGQRLDAITVVNQEIKRVVAQGRLIPKSGIVSVSSIPGDRIEQILVSVGDAVHPGQPLIKTRSEQLRRNELSVARSKLKEAEKQLEVKQIESNLAIVAARHKLEIATQQHHQAAEQLAIVESSNQQLISANRQFEILTKVRNDPLTRPLVGQLELETRQIDLDKADTTYHSSLLSAKQAVEGAATGKMLAQESLVVAEKSSTLVAAGFPIDSIREQIVALEQQIELSLVTAPVDATVLSISAERGELIGPLAIMELADCKEMVVQAEVHEADIDRLRIGQRATIESAALNHPLSGTIIRIDQIVGVPQMRSPNPTARTDFRSMPVLIAIDSKDVVEAAKRVQLQVDVSIAIH